MKIHIISLGGTICMRANSANAALDCALNADDLCASASLQDYEISCTSLCALPSPSLEISHILALLEEIKKAHAADISAFVITQGTDTLEESSFLLSLLCDLAISVVFTGAMRAPDDLGAEGGANLHAAATAAASLSSKHLHGVFLCMNDELFAPVFVHKNHSSSVAAFCATSGAAKALFIENRWRFLERAVFSMKAFGAAAKQLAEKSYQVGIYTTALGDDGAYLKAVSSGVIKLDGLIIDGFGAGHVNAAHAELVGQIASKIPVIVTSCCANGSAAVNTYGYAGSEVDLRSRGCLMGGFLSARKARLLLITHLANASDGHILSALLKHFQG